MSLYKKNLSAEGGIKRKRNTRLMMREYIYTGCFFLTGTPLKITSMGGKSIRTGTPQKVPAGTENSDTQFHLEILGGSQFESSEHLTYRRTLLRGSQLKQD